MPLAQKAPIESGGRDGYVLHQQGLARRALLMGEVGAACAALRVLAPDDFSDPASARALLEVVRDPLTDSVQRLNAATELLLLDPH